MKPTNACIIIKRASAANTKGKKNPTFQVLTNLKQVMIWSLDDFTRTINDDLVRPSAVQASKMKPRSGLVDEN